MEYRTDIDDFLPKETDKHFRKGLTSGEIFELVNLSGAKVTYFRQGFGFAKFGADDAHVGRLVLERSGE